MVLRKPPLAKIQMIPHLGPSMGSKSVKLAIERNYRSEPTRETPYVSHLANERGNTGKSTARMERTVIKIMWALYVVRAGSWTIGDS